MGVGRITPDEIFTREERDHLSHCTMCPRECGVNRFDGERGYCGADAGMNIATICIHRGEEPPVSGPDGICNIFFARCNMSCIYCQNHDISRRDATTGMKLSEVINAVEKILSEGIKAVGFVSPSHVVPQVKAIIRGLNSRGLKPVTVYNTNSYDKAETLKDLAGMIDVYLPDYKYVTPAIAREYSDAFNYPEIALKAIKEMYYQKGSVLHIDRKGRADAGLLIRHLVLPGGVEESKKVLKKIAEELSQGIHISLMSQYHPTPFVMDHPVINRRLDKKEYESVIRVMEDLGFRHGWVQDMDSYKNYQPDFSRKHPFE